MRRKSSYDKFLKINEAFCDSRLKLSDKAVFQRLVWRVNLKTGACYPSVGLIAKELSMTDRGVRKCMARLEQENYIKRVTHAGRTKANDYLISGLNTERQFRKTGTDIPENRNEYSAHIRKERKKEKEASEEKTSDTNVALTAREVTKKKVEPDQFQIRLVNALGGGEHGWNALMNVSSDRLDELQRGVVNGSMSIDKAARGILTELTTEDVKT